MDHPMKTSLYVGDLAYDVNEALLWEIFSTCGQIASIHVCRDALTGKSLGYAYVNFHDAEDAARALEDLNYTMIHNRLCRIMYSERNPHLRKTNVGNIFVKNLDPSIDHRDLASLFSMFGKILSCKVAMDDEGNSRGYGFVHFENEEDAQRAIESVNEKQIAGKIVTVESYKSKAQRTTLQDSFTNLYVKHLPEDFKLPDLEELFSPFGGITSCHLATTQDGTSRGFGFVNFENHDDAVRAIDELHEKDVGFEKTLYVARAMKRSERDNVLKESRSKQREEQLKRWEGCNLYLKNLDESVDEDILTEEFSVFGELESVKVARDPETKEPKGFGFVCFKDREDAANALKEMNNRMIAGKPLYVNYFQDKETRMMNMRKKMAAQPQPVAVAPRPVHIGIHPRAMHPMGMEQPIAMGAPMAAPDWRLSLQQLAAADPQARRQMLGEALYPLVHAIEPEYAGKITGMLLDMDQSDILELIESPALLHEKVLEAREVLLRYQTSG